MKKLIWVKPLFIVLVWITTVSMPLEMLHGLAYVIHMVYESISYVIEMPLIHFLEWKKHHAQMFVFYSSVFIGILLFRWFLCRCLNVCVNVKNYWLHLLLLLRQDVRQAIRLLADRNVMANVIGITVSLVMLLAV